MSLTVGDTGGDFQKAPEGTHLGRCYRIIDLGTQFNEKWNTHQRKVLISWELPTELMEDERPFSVSAQYTASLSEKAYLRRDLEAWRGKKFSDEELESFELSRVLGTACMLNIVHNESYANVQGIVALPKGMECPEVVNPLQKFDIDNPDMDLFESFTDKMKDRIRKAPEWSSDSPNSTYGTAHGQEFEDDIPF